MYRYGRSLLRYESGSEWPTKRFLIRHVGRLALTDTDRRYSYDWGRRRFAGLDRSRGSACGAAERWSESGASLLWAGRGRTYGNRRPSVPEASGNPLALEWADDSG